MTGRVRTETEEIDISVLNDTSGAAAPPGRGIDSCRSHICTLYDVGPNYLVLEFVEGTLLNGPLAIQNAVDYAGREQFVQRAIQMLHDEGTCSEKQEGHP